MALSTEILAVMAVLAFLQIIIRFYLVKIIPAGVVIIRHCGVDMAEHAVL